MKHPLLAAAAAITAVLVGAACLGGPWFSVAMAAVLVIAAALGWPQLLGAPARKSLTAVLGVSGLAAVGAVSLWPGQSSGEGPTAFGASLIEPIAVCMALGVVAAFMVQLFRGSGSPQRLESTAGTITGVAVVCAGAGWVALARYDAGPLAVSVGLSLALAALAGLVPFPGRSGRGLAAGLSLVLAGVVPVVVEPLWPASWGALSLPAAVVAGLLGGLVLVLTGRTAPDRGLGRPLGRRAAVALGVAPVAVVGLLTYFVFRIMPV
ncbi:hypothetical protein [Citricoccus sp.]|uniref:hypothetical protein n=1 Tax=Citricoccus sp. TaxID=1978372 RepID=UPI0028BD2783|nr:hypothetical protein [Citricoccus sp.]